MEIANTFVLTSMKLSPVQDPETQALVLKLVVCLIKGGDCNSFTTARELQMVLKRCLPLPHTLRRFMVPQLSEDEYWICEKTDGTRALCLLCEYGVYFILRDWKPYILSSSKDSLSLQNALSKPECPTLLDGELVHIDSFLAGHGGGTEDMDIETFQKYMIFDIVMSLGKRVSEDPLSTRLMIIGHVVQRFRQYCNTDIEFLGKNYYPKNHIPQLLKKIQKTENGKYLYCDGKRVNYNDGLLFVPEKMGFTGIATRLLKYKWQDRNTLDFVVHPDQFFQNNECLPGYMETDYGEQYATLIHLPHAIQMAIMNSPNKNHHPVVECYFDKTLGLWHAYLHRKDKMAANSIIVGMQVMELLLQNLQIEELIKVCASGKTNVK